MHYGQCPTLLESGERCSRSAMHKGQCSPTRTQRKVCPDCGRIFRKSGVGLAWHLEAAHRGVAA